jgi:hypothetical protein
MTFEEKLITNSDIRQKNLMRPAKVAFEKPDTGVKILKKGAYYLIKDASEITIQYLAHLCYGSYKNPLKDLRGKFTQSEIIDFVGRAKEEKNTSQLLNIILTDIGSAQVDSIVNSSEVIEEEVEIDLSMDDNVDDIYGDYEADTPVTKALNTNVKSKSVDVTDASSVISKLIEVFNVK